MKLTLGPILYTWKREEIFKFYKAALDWPVDTVYIGEVVCEKKRTLTIEDIEVIGKNLESAGKKVIISTLAIVSNVTELALTRDFASLPFALEANDVSAIAIAKKSNQKIFAGPHIKTYNERDAEFLKEVGVSGICLPIELPRDSIKNIVKKTDLPCEVFAFGKAPLAFSWRCYTERHYGLTKEECKHHCTEDPEGMALRSSDNPEGSPVFTVNGTSILSGTDISLLNFTEDLEEIGLASLRISPQYKGTEDVINIFKEKIDGQLSNTEAEEKLKTLNGRPFTNGYYQGKAGKDLVEASSLVLV